MRKYNEILDNIEFSDKVYITGHKGIDLDAFGSMLGVYSIAKYLNKVAKLYLEEEIEELCVNRALTGLHRRNFDLDYINEYDELDITQNSLLIIVDVNKSKLIPSFEKIKLFKNIIIIDHHIDVEDKEINSKIKYIDNKSSSVCEMLTFFIKENEIKIEPYIATIMLGGIIIDTNSFTSKTSSKTHLAASLLYDLGADSQLVNYLLKMDIKEYKEINKVIDNVKIIKKIFAIVYIEDTICDKELLSKVSEALLTFNEIEAAFTIGNIENDLVGISARSLGYINVNDKMVQLGGGGHKFDAAAQIKNKSIQEVYDEMLKIL